jgi:hypothetical protein
MKINKLETAAHQLCCSDNSDYVINELNNVINELKTICHTKTCLIIVNNLLQLKLQLQSEFK